VIVVGRCPACSYPMAVREDGRVWCSVYGTHAWSKIQPRPGRPPIVFGEFTDLVREIDGAMTADERLRARASSNYRGRTRAKARLRAVGAA
jgi:uncharacterized Zn finger protein (UPF0148 family)